MAKTLPRISSSQISNQSDLYATNYQNYASHATYIFDLFFLSNSGKTTGPSAATQQPSVSGNSMPKNTFVDKIMHADI